MAEASRGIHSPGPGEGAEAPRQPSYNSDTTLAVSEIAQAAIAPPRGTPAPQIEDVRSLTGHLTREVPAEMLEGLSRWVAKAEGSSVENYAEAERLIVNAYKQCSHKLILAELQLKSLPAEIGLLTKLTGLDLEHNQLTDLPPEIRELTNLTHLSLNYNQLTSLPEWIGLLTNLTELYLSHNELTDLLPEIGLLTNLTELKLFGNRLTSLPPEIRELTNLTALDLGCNQRTSLPPEIGLLTKLTELSLYHNQLTSLPAEIGQLTNLMNLDLEHNQLTSLPEWIGRLTKLTELDLEHNQLTDLPPEIRELTNLTELILFGNRLTSLPPEIRELTNLTKLVLGYNQLPSLPEGIGGLNNLTYLDLENNRLTSLPPSFFDLPEAVFVWLYNNNFSEQHVAEIQRRVGNRFTVGISIRERGSSTLNTVEGGLKSLQDETGIEDIAVWDFSEEDSRRLLTFFQYLENSLAYKGEHKKVTAEFLIKCFALAKDDEQFKAVFLTHLVDASGTYGDRVSYYLNSLNLQYCLFSNTFPEGFTIPDFFVGLFRLNLLDRAATEFVKTYRGVIDPIEVYLALQVKLQERLHLPLLAQEMIYFRVASLEDRDIEGIYDGVRSQTPDTKETLLQSDAWAAHLAETYAPDEYEALNIAGSDNPQIVRLDFVVKQTDRILGEG